VAPKKPQKKEIPKNDYKRKMLIYIALVSFFSILFFIFSNQLWFEPFSKKILSGYAHISSFLLNLFGQDTRVFEENITSSAFSISVRKGCDAIAPMILYIFGIVFFPVNYKHKLRGIGIGITVLAVVNIIRIFSLFLIGKYTNQRFFDIMHVDIWQILFIMITLFIWVQWLKKAISNQTQGDVKESK
jgi:exosortase/archaeosortase family protein